MVKDADRIKFLQGWLQCVSLLNTVMSSSP